MIRARTSSSHASRCIPSASTPAARSRANQPKSAGGSHCAWIGNPVASLIAAAAAASTSAPRSSVGGVPVVSTTLRTPSSCCAAAATSASCAGVLRGIVRPARKDSPMAQNWHRVARLP